jgi:hypothetical protein
VLVHDFSGVSGVSDHENWEFVSDDPIFWFLCCWEDFGWCCET